MKNKSGEKVIPFSKTGATKPAKIDAEFQPLAAKPRHDATFRPGAFFEETAEDLKKYKRVII